MEAVQGYVILKTAAFETGHGFALGHNPGAPNPFVTGSLPRGKTAIGITTGAAMEPVRRGRRGTLTTGWTTISSFTMRRSSIPSWDRRAFTAIIPPSGPWT